jgi:hypothetical protein
MVKKMSHGASESMESFTAELLPGWLVEACGVELAKAEAIGRDVLVRAEGLAALSPPDRNALIAPFIEEVVDYEPRRASLPLKAAVTVVLRNSLLEEEHAAQRVGANDVQVMTTVAAAPLAQLLNARFQRPLSPLPDSPFAHLKTTYPRAWAALQAAADTLADGGRRAYHVPDDAPIPSLPRAEQVIAARPSKQDARSVIQSAIDPAFNQQHFDLLQQAIAHSPKLPFYVSSLSRISRNSDKLLYVIELLLSHGVPILTSNYLLRAGDVWVRKGIPVIPIVIIPTRVLTI